MRIESVEDPVIFDTDCLVSFASVPGGLDLIKKTLRSVWTTTFVLTEMDNDSGDAHSTILAAVQKGTVGTYGIPVGDDAFRTFQDLTDEDRRPVLGDGEAAAIALVETYGGTVASNNLRDIAALCRKKNIPFMCTDDILSLAVDGGLISIQDACAMWDEIRKSTILPRYDFNQAFKRFKAGLDR